MGRGNIDWSKVDFTRPQAEIAAEMGCSQGAVSSAKKRFCKGAKAKQAQPSLFDKCASKPANTEEVADETKIEIGFPEPPAEESAPAEVDPQLESDTLINSVGTENARKAALIWNVANSIAGVFKPHEYGLVILPMVVIKRFHDCLLPTHDAVLAAAEKYSQAHPVMKGNLLTKASGYGFYNTSGFTFETLRADSVNITGNFRSYIAGFSENVQDILNRMQFSAQIDRMVEANCLFQVIEDFCDPAADMSPDRVSAVDMGYIFENLVQRFSESYNEEAGAHFTSRDIIYLMSDLLVAGDTEIFRESTAARTVYDMTMGTSQMLTCMSERLKQLNADAVVECFGQEINPFTFGIAKADMLIRGGNSSNMRFGDTLSDDQFEGFDFDYCISNPPFGIDWKREAAKVEAEFDKGTAGRFAPGLPSKSDGQMLFLLNGISKLKKAKGRMAIIQNGSSLFTGDAGSGPSEIRRYVIENDWLDAIVQLPTDSFYNTGISTYIWVITKNKTEKREGKVQLIDASKCFEPRRKSIGSKRVDITGAARDLIVKTYGNYVDGTFETTTDAGNVLVCKSKVLDGKTFGYAKITVETPELDSAGHVVTKKGVPVSDKSRRDTENVPLTEDVQEYFAREVLPYNPGAWIDESKTKVGYEIPFTRTFYEYTPVEPAADIARRIEEHERTLMAKLHELFGEPEA